MFSHSSLSDVIDITADYKPESCEVSGGRFINTTPCDVGQPISYCDPQKPLESSVIVKLPVSIAKTINSAKGKQNYLSYYRLSGPKKVTLTNSNNGEHHELAFIPTNIGAKVIKMEYPIVNNNRWPMHTIGGDCYQSFSTWGGIVSQISQQVMTSLAPGDRYTRGFLTGRPRVFSLFMALTYAMTSPTWPL